MNVAAQRIQLGTILHKILNNNYDTPLSEKESKYITNMNVSAQDTKLADIVNKVINKENVQMSDKDINKLNNMNVAAQRAMLGTLLSLMGEQENYKTGGILNPITNVSDYIKSYNEYQGKDVYIVIENQTILDDGINFGQDSINDENPPRLHIIIKNCEFDNSSSIYKNIFLSNCQELLIEKCKFLDNTNSDYAIDINLCTIQDAEIIIKDCIFISSGTKGAIHISQRKGSTDLDNTIATKISASIKSVVIADCYFDGNKSDVVVGEMPKGSNEANVSTGEFEMLFNYNTTKVVLQQLYLFISEENINNNIIPISSSITKLSNGVLI